MKTLNGQKVAKASTLAVCPAQYPTIFLFSDSSPVGTHETDGTPWVVHKALRGGFVRLKKAVDGEIDDYCIEWPHPLGGEKLYRNQDLSQEPFDQDLHANSNLARKFKRRQENGEYAGDKLPKNFETDRGMILSHEAREAVRAGDRDPASVSSCPTWTAVAARVAARLDPR